MVMRDKPGAASLASLPTWDLLQSPHFIPYSSDEHCMDPTFPGARSYSLMPGPCKPFSHSESQFSYL